MALPKQIRGYAQIMDLSIKNAQIDNATVELAKLVEWTELIKRDGSVVMTWDLDLWTKTLKNVANWVNAQDAIAKSQLDSAVSTLNTSISDEVSRATAAEWANSTAIATEKWRVDAILNASDADKDSFAEIVSLINSVDTENDDALAWYVTSNNTRVTNVETSVSDETSRATAAETANTTAITWLSNDKFDKVWWTISGSAVITWDFETQGSATFNWWTFWWDATFNWTVTNINTNVAWTWIETDLSASASVDKLANAAAIKAYVDTKASAQDEAKEISFDNTASELTASNVQSAIDELDSAIDALSSTWWATWVPVDNETPTWDIDWTNTDFVLASSPKTGSEKVFYNGSRMVKPWSYTISWTTITFTFAPEVWDEIIVDYRK